MKDEKCCSAIGGYAFRIALGSLLLLTGVEKFTGGVGTFVEKTSGMFAETFLPMAFVTAFLTVVPLIEVVAGGLILLGLFSRVGAYAAALLFALFAAGLTASGNMEMVTSNFIFMFASAWLAQMPAGSLSVDYLIRHKKSGK